MLIISSLKEWKNFIDSNKNLKTVIFGAKLRAKIIYKSIEKDIGSGFNFFLTTEYERDTLFDKPVKTIKEIENTDQKRIIVIIAAKEKFLLGIENELEKIGINKKNMIFFTETIYSQLLENLEIFKKLCDKESEMIFENIAKFRLTGDFSVFAEIQKKSNFNTLNHKKDYAWFFKKGLYQKSGIAFYGVNWISVYVTLPRLIELGVKIDYICIEEEKIKYPDKFGIPIVSTLELGRIWDDKYLLMGYDIKDLKIIDDLLEKGFNENKIIYSCLGENPLNYGMQYFDLKELETDYNEVFVDVGCLDCGTVEDFIDWCGNKSYKEIIAFEPDDANYLKCEDIIAEKKIARCQLVKKGLWDKSEVLNFSSEGSCLSSIQETGNITIETISLDEYLKGNQATFIKMDIEGAELKALKGAEKTILEFKPKLAISIYHKPDDFFDILNYLSNLVPEYNFYIRHYSVYKVETILYAFIER